MSILKKNTHQKTSYSGGESSEMMKVEQHSGIVSDTTSWLKMILLVLYIFLKYPIKYSILLSLLTVMVYLFAKGFEYMCKAFVKLGDFVNKMLNPGELNLIIFTIGVNPFTIFEAVVDLVIGVLYAAIGIMFLIGLGLMTLPFNIVFTL